MIQYDIIIRPLITEKTMIQREELNQYAFEVDKKANRIEIQRAVEQIFGVRVTTVKTMNINGKWKRRGRILGKRKDWKKAIVTLAPGQRIESFEGA